jgi:hypothetical protein
LAARDLNTARPAEFLVANTEQAALDGVFLHHVPDRPEIVGAVVVTAGNKQLFSLDRLGFALAVTKTENMGGVRKNIPFVTIQSLGQAEGDRPDAIIGQTIGFCLFFRHATCQSVVPKPLFSFVQNDVRLDVGTVEGKL